MSAERSSHFVRKTRVLKIWRVEIDPPAAVPIWGLKIYIMYRMKPITTMRRAESLRSATQQRQKERGEQNFAFNRRCRESWILPVDFLSRIFSTDQCTCMIERADSFLVKVILRWNNSVVFKFHISLINQNYNNSSLNFQTNRDSIETVYYISLFFTWSDNNLSDTMKTSSDYWLKFHREHYFLLYMNRALPRLK